MGKSEAPSSGHPGVTRGERLGSPVAVVNKALIGPSTGNEPEGYRGQIQARVPCVAKQDSAPREQSEGLHGGGDFSAVF